jgi:hypothetical protein
MMHRAAPLPLSDTLTAIPPDLVMVDCSARSLRLSNTGCSRLWVKANNGPAPAVFDGISACRGCSVGYERTHGYAPNPVLAFLPHLAVFCPRCFRPSGDRALICDLLCASCDARNRECIKRRNSKGHPPQLTYQLHEERIVLSVAGGTPQIVVRQSTWRVA